MKVAAFDALMAVVRHELRKGRIVEAPLEAGDGECLDGMVDSTGTIYIDPGPQLLDVVIHEALHRAFPRWGEARVCKTAHQLVMSMDDAERRAWVRRYRRVARRSSRPVQCE